jgi:DNA-binding transcriptional LysR family regulator
MTGRIERLKVFLAVADKQSFAAAAKALGMTRSAATRYVSELEADIGARLLTRTTRSVALTAAGRVYAEHAGPVVAELARAEELAREQQQTLKGDLRISVPLSFGLQFLPDVISQYRILYPQVRLKLDLSDRFVDFAQDDFDMALRIAEAPVDKSSIWRKILPAPRGLFAAPSYLSRRDPPETAEDLNAHDRLVYAHGADVGAWTLRHAKNGATRVIDGASCFACNNGDLIGELAVRGEGIALLPRFIVAPHVARGALVEILAEWRPPELWLGAFYPPYDVLPAKVSTFTRFVEEAAKAEMGLLG